MHKRFDTGKQPYEAAKDTQATAHSQKPLDFVRLSSQSTRENPRLLGGTPQEAQDFLKNLSTEKKKAYNEYINFKARCRYHGNAQATEMARLKYPLGYDIHNEYQRIYKRTAKGESSTTNNSSREDDSDWTDAIYQDWNDE